MENKGYRKTERKKENGAKQKRKKEQRKPKVMEKYE